MSLRVMTRCAQDCGKETLFPCRIEKKGARLRRPIHVVIYLQCNNRDFFLTTLSHILRFSNVPNLDDFLVDKLLDTLSTEYYFRLRLKGLINKKIICSKKQKMFWITRSYKVIGLLFSSSWKSFGSGIIFACVRIMTDWALFGPIPNISKIFKENVKKNIHTY